MTFIGSAVQGVVGLGLERGLGRGWLGLREAGRALLGLVGTGERPGLREFTSFEMVLL